MTRPRELALLDVRDVGSVAWLERTGGALSKPERSYLLRGLLPMLLSGFRLRGQAKRSPRRRGALDPFEPPATPIVSAARALLEGSASREMTNHSLRTGFWTMVVLDTHTELTPQLVETAWMAALLHDIGFYLRADRGDFSAGGVAALKQLAREHRWSDQQVHEASEAIVANLSTRVDPARFGMVAWAMNVGGAGELGIWPHRAQMDRARLEALEARFPRDRFRQVALADIDDEVRRMPQGRFALLRWVYWLLMRS